MSEGWPMVPLDEILQLQRRWLQPHPTETYAEIGVRSFGNGIFHKTPVLGSQLGNKRVLRIEPGDLVFNNVFGWEGAVAVAGSNEAGKIGSHRFLTFTVDPARASADYLKLYFATDQGLELLGRASPGSAGRNRTLSIDRFTSQRIPLPTLPEQRRILAYVEKLASKIGEAQRLRKEAASSTEQVVAAAARAAFARLKGAPTAPVAEVGTVRGGIQKSPDRVPAGNPVRYLTVAHVGRNRISLDSPRFFELEPDELTRWRLESGDVLVIEGNGSAEEIGRAALFRGEIEDCVHQNHVIRIRPDRSRIDPEFLNAYLNSPVGRDEVQALSRTTSGLRSLSVGRIKQILVPLPPIVDQQGVVTELEVLQCRFDGLKRMQGETQVELDAMLPAVLERAFRGEL